MSNEDLTSEQKLRLRVRELEKRLKSALEERNAWHGRANELFYGAAGNEWLASVETAIERSMVKVSALKTSLENLMAIRKEIDNERVAD